MVVSSSSSMVVPVSVESEEFARLQFRLRMATRSTGLTLRRAFALCPGGASAGTAAGTPLRQPMNGKTLEGWVPIAAPPGMNSGVPSSSAVSVSGSSGVAAVEGMPESVWTKAGGLVNVSARTGLDVYVGNLARVAKTTEKMVLCDLHIGRAYLQPTSAAALGHDDLPAGYDALYVRSALAVADESAEVTMSPGVEGRDESEDGVFEHKYVVFSSQSVVGRYLLEFELGEEVERQQLVERRQRRVCEGCGERPASLWCEMEKVQLCGPCDREVHKHPLLEKTHKRVAMTEEHTKYVHKKAVCVEHPEGKTAEYYCLDCKRVVCVECKVSGSHSLQRSGMASHALRTLTEMYGEVDQRLKRRSEEVEEYRRELHAQRTLLETEIRKTVERGEEVERELRLQLSRAIEAVEKIVTKKRRILESNVGELMRQEEELDWGFSYIQYASELIDPSDFLSMWRYYGWHEGVIVRQGVDKRIPVPSTDIYIEGHLSISSPSMDVFEAVGSPKRLAPPHGRLLTTTGVDAAHDALSTMLLPPATTTATTTQYPPPQAGGMRTPVLAVTVAQALMRGLDHQQQQQGEAVRSPRQQAKTAASPRLFASKLKELEENARATNDTGGKSASLLPSGSGTFTKCLPDWAARHNVYTKDKSNGTPRANTFN